jgi:hypothetical protein
MNDALIHYKGTIN